MVPANLLPRETAEGFSWETMPSAELASGQRDPMKWFYHDWLLCYLLGDTLESAALGAGGADAGGATAGGGVWESAAAGSAAMREMPSTRGPLPSAHGAACSPGPSLDDAACAVLERYLDDRLLGSDVGKWVRYYGLDEPRAFADDLEWVLAGMRSSAFKHIQAPPVIALASHASVRRAVEPQLHPEPSARYRALLARVRRL